MKRRVWVIFCTAAIGCGGANASTRGNASTTAAGQPTSRNALESELASKGDELRALRTKLSLAQAETDELKIRRSMPRAETVRIAPAPPIPVDDWEEPPPANDNGRPVLRLWGDGDKGLETSQSNVDIDIDVIETLPRDPVSQYRSGLGHLKMKKFAKALTVFDNFSRLHPGHSYADNALYWSGEIHFIHRRYDKALVAYRRVLDEYPNGNKVPDALYKLGKIHLRRGAGTQAKPYFQQLRDRYPDSAAAQLASREDAS